MPTEGYRSDEGYRGACIKLPVCANVRAAIPSSHHTLVNMTIWSNELWWWHYANTKFQTLQLVLPFKCLPM